jgi:phosphatidylinositol alpha-1,6-mannosyltransferase
VSARARVATLFVTRNLPPLVGGMERHNERVFAALTRLGPAIACGPTGFAAHARTATARLAPAPDLAAARIVEVPPRPVPVFLAGAALRATAAALRHRPAVVVAGSGVTAPIAWFAARSCGARVAVFVHGLDVVARHALYRRAFVPFLGRCDAVVANSRATARCAVSAGVRPERVDVLHPGTTLPEPGGADADGFRRRHALGAGPVLLSVGRLTPRKGLPEFVVTVLPRLLAERPDLRLVVVGANATDAVGASGSERARIEAAVDAAGVAPAVRVLGRVDDAELESAYAAATVHVFPVREQPGDMEGFGMVAVEAAARGVPTVAYAVGGVVDAVADPDSGRLVAPDDADAFRAAVLELASRPPDARARVAAACRAFAQAFGWERFDARVQALVARLAGGA